MALTPPGVLPMPVDKFIKLTEQVKQSVGGVGESCETVFRQWCDLTAGGEILLGFQHRLHLGQENPLQPLVKGQGIVTERNQAGKRLLRRPLALPQGNAAHLCLNIEDQICQLMG